MLVRLRNGKGQPLISSRHCYITFDGQRRLIVQDCSTRGTIVTYDDKGRERRRNFKWIIGGHQVLNETKTVVIEIHPELKFQIVVSKDHLYPDLFFDNVGQFLDDVATNDELPIGALGIQTALSTAAPSGRNTPNQRPILLKRGRLGEGSFGVVSRVWDVSTGLEYAFKKCRNPREFDWRREADVMRDVSHEHIVKLCATLDGPSPQLLLEYLPLGNLEDQHYLQPVSEHEVSTLLRQSSSALSYLHDQIPPVVHRDIKPENILVLSRSPFHIKLSDFGLAKAGGYLESICGTLLYAATEIAQYYHLNSTGSPRYTSAVDIWSLGVVVFQYSYSLPKYGRKSRLSWCEQIVDELKDWDFDSLLDILFGMLVIDPKQRYSAEECLERAGELEGPQTPTPMTYERQQRRARQPNPTVLDPRDSELQRYIRSQVPLRSVAQTTLDKRKRPTRRSTTSSSSTRRTKRAVAENSLAHLPYEEPSSAQDWQNDPRYGEQNNNLGWDAFALDANAQGFVNYGQGTKNARHSRAATLSMSYGIGDFVNHEKNSLERDAFVPDTGVSQGLAIHGEPVWTDSVFAARLQSEIRRLA